MKWLSIPIVVVLIYFACVHVQAALVLCGPYDGTKDQVDRMLEKRDYVLSQWNFWTGIMFADWGE